MEQLQDLDAAVEALRDYVQRSGPGDEKLRRRLAREGWPDLDPKVVRATITERYGSRTPERRDANNKAKRERRAAVAELVDDAGVSPIPDGWEVTGVSAYMAGAQRGWVKVRPKSADDTLPPFVPARSTIAMPRVLERERIPGQRVALIVPDSQNGYIRPHRSGPLVPLHDRRAWDVVVQVAESLQPDVIDVMGDMLDLAAWGKFSTDQSYRGTTQAAVDELHWWLVALRQAVPASQIRYHGGNHEARINRALADRLDEASRLCRAGEHVPVMSVRHLLHLDALGIEWLDYGAPAWLWDDKARAEHGQDHGKAALERLLARSLVSSYQGHGHHARLMYKTIESHTGKREIWAMEAACLCHTDGRVPGMRKGQQDWQNGFGVVREFGDETYPELVRIIDGRAMVSGQAVEGLDRSEEIGDATGFPM